MPLPSPEATPPVTKMNLVSFTTGIDSNRPDRQDRGLRSSNLVRQAPEVVEPPERGDRLDGPGERDGLREHVETDHDERRGDQPRLREPPDDLSPGEEPEERRARVAEHPPFPEIGDKDRRGGSRAHEEERLEVDHEQDERDDEEPL